MVLTGKVNHLTSIQLSMNLIGSSLIAKDLHWNIENCDFISVCPITFAGLKYQHGLPNMNVKTLRFMEYTSILAHIPMFVTSEIGTRCRMDAEIVVYSKLSQKPRYQKYEVQNRRQKSSQSKTLSKPRIRISELTGKDWAESEYLNKLAYTNRHRIKIDVLTVWQMDRLE